MIRYVTVTTTRTYSFEASSAAEIDAAIQRFGGLASPTVMEGWRKGEAGMVATILATGKPVTTIVESR
jgi:hypothetical protein